MLALRTLSKIVLLGLCLNLPLAHSQESSLPDAKQIQRSLDTLADRKLSASDQQTVQDILKNTLQLLDQKDQHEQALTEVKRKITQAPQLIKDAQKELAKLRAEQEKPVVQRYANLSAQELENLQNQRNTQLNDWQNALNDANTLVINSQTRPERAQIEISNTQARVQAIADILKSGKESGKPITSEQRNQLIAEQAERNALIQLRKQELSGNSTLQDLGTVQRELYTERVRRIEQESLDLQALISSKRRQQSEETFAALSRESQKTAGNNNDVLTSETNLNLKLSDYLLRATDRLNELTRSNLEVKQRLDQLKQTGETMEQQINVLRGSLLLSKLLYQQRASLPTVESSKDLTDEIGDIRLYQFDLNQQRAQIANPLDYLDKIMSQVPSEQANSELRKQLSELIKTRADLQDRLSTELSALLSESITLQLNQQQLLATSESLRATLDEQMFWIPSNRPLDWSLLKDAPQSLGAQITNVPWRASLGELSAGLAERPWLFLPLIVAIAALLWKRHYLYEKLNALNKDIGHFQRDSQLHTPLAIVLTVLLALPVSLSLGLVGVALEGDRRGVNASIGAALMEMAAGWLVFYTVYRLLEGGGVAETHFRWSRTQIDSMRRLVRRLGLLALALMAVAAIAQRQLTGLAEDVLGILIVLICYASMSWMLGRSLLNAAARERLPFFRLALGLIITAIPAGLFLAVCMGYYYTSLKLTDRLIDTLYLLLCWVILEAAFSRGLGVAARRLAYHRALAKRQSMQESGEAGDVTEEPALDMEQVNQQSLRLIRLALWLGFLGVLYWVWVDVVAVFSYLDNVTLYQYSSGTGESATMMPITLRDFIKALIFAGLTVALARNLPGLLEVVVLSRLRLAQGTAYATTTLLSYVIISVGVISSLSTLGVSWDKLQWLAAALSVGLGFGLQEIFGNFISGLIILFERPVRIGDLITIGNVTGTVKRIQIRATHITDADNKSVIVPNKTFVTSQLINWTLTDTMTRITLLVGVAQNSDLEKVRELLYKAAYDNPRVLHDPEPLVLFQTFGENTLNHELRVHVRELGDRGFATDEINRSIERLFRENNIAIAFRQLEVSVKNMEGFEHLLNKVELPAPANSGQKE
jgi:potassium efflux system protein